MRKCQGRVNSNQSRFEMNCVTGSAPGVTYCLMSTPPSISPIDRGKASRTQALAMGLATTLAGFIISQDEVGLIVDYSVVGYVAITANLIAIWFVGRIAMHQRH